MSIHVTLSSPTEAGKIAGSLDTGDHLPPGWRSRLLHFVLVRPLPLNISLVLLYIPNYPGVQASNRPRPWPGLWLCKRLRTSTPQDSTISLKTRRSRWICRLAFPIKSHCKRHQQILSKSKSFHLFQKVKAKSCCSNFLRHQSILRTNSFPSSSSSSRNGRSATIAWMS